MEELKEVKSIDSVEKKVDNSEAERLEKANAELKELLSKQESLISQAKLAGRSLGGNEPKPETPVEYAKRVMSGKL